MSHFTMALMTNTNNVPNKQEHKLTVKTSRTFTQPMHLCYLQSIKVIFDCKEFVNISVGNIQNYDGSRKNTDRPGEIFKPIKYSTWIMLTTQVPEYSKYLRTVD